MRTGERQSFAAKVRDELIRLPAGKACCMLSEISALTQTSGHLAFRGGGWLSVSYRLEDAGVARRLFQLLKKRLSVNPTLHFTQTSRLGGRRTCVLTLSGQDARTLLEALHMTETDENGQMHLKRTVPRHPMTRRKDTTLSGRLTTGTCRRCWASCWKNATCRSIPTSAAASRWFT